MTSPCFALSALKKASIAFLGAFIAFGIALEAGAEQKKEVRIGFLNGMEIHLESSTIHPTEAYLKEKLPQYRFSFILVSPVDTLAEIKNEKLNFLIAPSNFSPTIADFHNIVHVATRKTVRAHNSSNSVGSVFIVRNDRKDLQTYKDLKNKTLAASLPNSLGGYLAGMGEIHRQGYSPESFFRKTSFLQFQTPDILNAVLTGAADVGILSSCVLEQAEEEGLVEQGALRVIEPILPGKGNGELSCLHSTMNLYPDLEVIAFAGTPEQEIRDVTIALLSMPDFNEYRWAIESDQLAVRNLLRTLHAGPFEYLNDWSLAGLYLRYEREFWIGVFALLLLVLYELRLNWLVKRRTSELRAALKERDELERQAKEERQKLSILERNGAMSQMGSILAHEAKQPLGTIKNYLEALRIYFSDAVAKDPLVKEVLANLDSEADRLNALVNSVRNFGRKENEPLKRADLASIAEKAIRTFKRNDPVAEKVKVKFKSESREPMVSADLLSLELLILNLIRNGAEAAAEASSFFTSPKVEVEIRDNGSSRLDVLVSNTGEKMTDEKMKRLTTFGESVKPDGLGVGLGIVRSIADHHGGDLSFRRRPEGGVTAVFTIDRCASGS